MKIKLICADCGREEIKRYSKTEYCFNCYYKIYKRQNRKLVSERQKNYHQNRMKKDPIYKLKVYLRTRLYRALKGFNKQSSAVLDIGCSIPELKTHLESKFKDGMSWENYGKWHVDHIRPLSSFDLSKKEECIKACHYSNLQPLWAIDNLKKRDKVNGPNL